MVTKADVVKTTIKENKKKTNEGFIYGTLKGVTDFYPLHDFPVNVSKTDGIILKQHFDNIQKALDNKDKQIETLKEIIQNDRNRLKKIEIILKKYGYM